MDAIAQLDERPLVSLTILSLSAPYLDSIPTSTTHNRPSTSSEINGAQPSPATLTADLSHYRDLFTKLRFSYVEQVTKERFLRAITASPSPEFTTSEENAQLHDALVSEKAGLKARKQEVREIIEALEEQGRQLAARYGSVTLRRAEVEELPAAIEELENVVVALREQQAAAQSGVSKSNDPELNLPLQPTLELLSDRTAELESIDAQLAALQSTLPVKEARIEQLREDVEMAEARKSRAVAEALEARQRRGGHGDDVEVQGRWLRGVEGSLRGMLEA